MLDMLTEKINIFVIYSINICRGPDGLKYKIVPGKTYREGHVKCLCDVEVRSSVLNIRLVHSH